MPDKNFFITAVDDHIEKHEVDVLETRIYKAITLFCHQLSANKFQIIEDRSKLLIAEAKTKKDAFSSAYKIIDRHTPEKIEQLIESSIKKSKEQYNFDLEPNVLDIFL